MMKEKAIYVYPNGVAMARLHNRRIIVVEVNGRLVVQFKRYAPNEKPQPGETYKRGIITKHLALSMDGAQGLAQALLEVLKQQDE